MARFTIIVATDNSNGISREGEIPWYSREDARFFRDTTIGKRKNVVIMGRHTYESIPEDKRPLENRRNVVISKKWKQEEHPDISVYPSLSDALIGIGGCINNYDEVFLCGGEGLYNEAIDKYLYLCNKILITKFKTSYDCDQFFPFDKVSTNELSQDPIKTRDYTRYIFVIKKYHEEDKYTNLLREIKDMGYVSDNTKFLTCKTLSFDLLRSSIPILTTRRLSIEEILSITLHYILGTKYENMPFLDKYPRKDEDDHISYIVEDIRKSRTTVMNGIHAEHICSTFITHSTYVDCMVILKCVDALRDLPILVSVHSIILILVAHFTQLIPNSITFIISDCYIPIDKGDQLSKITSRTPYPFPTIRLRTTQLHTLDDLNQNIFMIEGYNSWPHVS